MTLWKNVRIGLGVSVVFALVYIAGLFSPLEDRLYDFFLRFRPNRPHIDSVVFLELDDAAIAYNGALPWPSSIPADSLLRLKEYGARAAIFDIDYIDSILALIGGESQNDRYLSQTLALFDRGWLTMNLHNLPLNREQVQPRLLVEERFSYPVKAADDAHRGEGFVDILPMLSEFAQAAKGSGFSNIEPDNDGAIRRIYLVQNVHDHWYLQLAFAPLIDYLGRPDLVLEKRKLTVKQARVSDTSVRDIVIPLDTKGRMLLDWPRTDYKNTFNHISLADFSVLAEIESELETYSRALDAADLNFFIQIDSRLTDIPFILSDMKEFFDAAHREKTNALENLSTEISIADESFSTYIAYRNLSYALMAELLAQKPAAAVQAAMQAIGTQSNTDLSENAEMIRNEAEYIVQLVNALDTHLKRWHELSKSNEQILRDKFCIIGRVDAGTTGYGATPFYGKYYNVGIHGVVLDTILSEAFINPVSQWLNALFILIFIPLCVLVSIHLSPLKRLAAALVAAFFIIAIAIFLLRFANIYWGPTGIVLALLITLIIREIIFYIRDKKEKRKLIGQRL